MTDAKTTAKAEPASKTTKTKKAKTSDSKVTSKQEARSEEALDDLQILNKRISGG